MFVAMLMGDGYEEAVMVMACVVGAVHLNFNLEQILVQVAVYMVKMPSLQVGCFPN